MKNVLFACALVLASSPAWAQAPAGGQAPMKIGIAMGLQRSYNGIKMNLTEMSTKMPEADYTFQPTKDVRTFGQLMGHVANSQFNTRAAAKVYYVSVESGKVVEKMMEPELIV